jgi:hypothetical protein
MSAGRLDGDFGTQEKDQAANTNDACLVMNDEVNFAFGQVTGVANGCTVEIDWFTPEPHKMSATALKGTKTEGSAKVDQSIFIDVTIRAFDTDGALGATCAIATPLVEFFASVNENVEKCKASASIKGTAVEPPGADTVQSSSVSASCELGLAGANLVVSSPVQAPTTPTQVQIDAVVAAFDGRKDVKLDNKGKLSIKQKGVPDTTPGTPGCD